MTAQYSDPGAKRFFTWFDGISARAKRSPVGKVLSANGWEICHTGGGCLAWQKDSADEKFYAWITYADNELGERVRKPEMATFCVGLYGTEGGFINPPEEITGIRAAAAWCDTALADPKAMFAKAKAEKWVMEDVEEIGS